MLIHFAIFALIALVLSLGQSLFEVVYAFVCTAVFVSFLTLILFIVPNLSGHLRLIDAYGEVYLDKALDAVNDTGVVRMFVNHWFYTVDKDLKCHTETMGP